MATKIQARRDTAANWTSVNPVLADGEIGYEKDTHKVKFGDGTTAWTGLPYFGGSAGASIVALAADLAPLANSTVLTNVTGLAAPIGASATEQWLLRYYLLVSAGNTTMDLKFGFTVPTAATMRWGGVVGGSQANTAGVGASQTTSNVTALLTETGSIPLGSPTGVAGISLAAFVFGGGTAGNVQLQYAQNVADAANLQILKGSFVEALKVAS